MMDRRLIQLFDQLVDMEPEQQDAVLDRLGDETRRELELLLARDRLFRDDDQDCEPGALETTPVTRPTMRASGEEPFGVPELSPEILALIEKRRGQGDALAGHALGVDIGSMVGNYRIVHQLDEGGMGVVYLAEHDELGSRAVIKVLRPELARNRASVERFHAEARAAAMIQHPGIVKVMDIGSMSNGCSYILMEYLAGETLQARLRSQGKLCETTAISMILQVARALAAAHDKSIVHRDLKPSNIFLVNDPEVTGGERAKILDFGIAKLVERQSVLLTFDDMAMGTPPYMPPEQFTDAANVDHRADLYALGVILFEMVCGRTPFQRRSLVQYARAHMEEPPPPVHRFSPEISRGLARVIACLLEKSRECRFDASSELIDALERVIPGDTPAGRRKTPLTPSASLESPVARPGALDATEHAGDRISTDPEQASELPGSSPGSGLASGMSGLEVSAPSPSPSDMRVREPGPFATDRPDGGPDSDGDCRATRTRASGRSRRGAPRARRVSGRLVSLLATFPVLAVAVAVVMTSWPRTPGAQVWDLPVEQDTIEAIGLVRASSAVHVLLEALQEKPPLSIEAVRVLRDLGVPDAAPRVRALLEPHGGLGRVELAASLLAMGDADGAVILEKSLEDRTEMALVAGVALAEAGRSTRAGPAMRRVFDQEHPGRRSWLMAARALLALGDAEAREALRTELARPELERAVAAAGILARANDEMALAALRRWVRDPGFAHRGQSAVILAGVDDAQALDYVADGLRDDEPRERQRAIAVAGRLARRGGEEHRESIRQMAESDASRKVRITARIALGEFSAPLASRAGSER